MMTENTNKSKSITSLPLFRRIQLRNNCTKKDAAASNRWKEFQDLSISEVWKRYPNIDGNNAVICGAANAEDPFLYVIDFDRTRSNEHFNEILGHYNSTIAFLIQMEKIIRQFFDQKYFYFLITGSKGAHFYFYISDGWEHRTELCNTSTPVNFEGIPLSGIDTRGQGGFVFGEGSDFSKYEPVAVIRNEGKPNETRKYTYHLDAYRHPKILNSTIPVVSFAKMEKFLNYVKANKYTEDTPKTEREIDYIAAIRHAIPISQKKSVYKVSCKASFEIYEKMLSGEYIINHLSQVGIDEFKIWNALWLYIYHNKLDFEECKQRLAKNQPEFDLTETNRCFQYMIWEYYPCADLTFSLWQDYLNKQKWGKKEKEGC